MLLTLQQGFLTAPGLVPTVISHPTHPVFKADACTVLTLALGVHGVKDTSTYRDVYPWRRRANVVGYRIIVSRDEAHQRKQI